MHYPEIDFSRIRSAGAEGQRSGFEQFVCELAAEDPPQDGAVFVSLAGAGGDGGVECFWTLAGGTEVGWQAKYWIRREDVDKAQLDHSVRTALEQHPQLVEYIIAIPVDPTGPRQGRGKSLHEKVYDPGGWLSGWQSAASQRGMKVTFRVEWATNLITRFRNIDVRGARTRYWFDAEILADQWWQDRLEEAVQAARPRYLPALNVQVPTTQALAAVCGDPEVAVALDSDISSLRHLTDNVRRDPLGTETAGAPVAVEFDPARQSLAHLIDALTRWKDDPSLDAAAHLREALITAQQQVASAEKAETAALDAQFGSRWDTPSWRQMQAEYMVSLPATAVDALRQLEEALTELASRVHALAGLRSAHAVLLTSEAGQGKTFVTLDTVQRRLDRGLLGVFLHGRPFHQGDILQQVRERLGLPQDLSGDDVLSLLDQAGRSSGNPVLVVVDALNESRPRTVWQDQLDTLITKIKRYTHLRVVFTVRSHYRSQVLPEDLELTEIVHHGFASVEHDALQEYADYFHLEPPAAPPVQTEFSSPLFLRLLCEALNRQGRRSLNEASLGLDALATLLLGQINRRISKQLGALEADQIVQQAMNAFAQALSSAGQPWLDRPQANTLMRSIWADQRAETSLLDALVGEGLLAEDTDSEATGLQRHVVAMAFERLGQHLVVSAATRALTTAADVRQALASGSLRDLLGLNALVDPGLLEALSVILGDRGMELTDFADEVGDDQSLTAVVAGLAWRDQSSITPRTAQAVLDSLATPAFPEALDMLFRLAPRPDHPLNAEFLHQSLAGRSMADVDSLLTPWLHHTRDTGGAAHRLISWARHADVTRTTPRTCRLWVMALLWCTGCSDRRVRDDATMAAARLLIQHPEQIPAVLQQITDADDDWILERACYAAYTALLRAGSAATWNGAAHAVWEMVFAPAPRANAVLRDVARSVISRAQEHGALADGIDIGRTRPPYDTPWPITWPAAADIQFYKDASARYPKLHFSCTADDFFTYVITPAVRDYPDLDPAAVARRVVTDVIGLGYDPALHSDFDHDVLDTYGGGRSNPKWIERIGKKYQWIAFARLLGGIGDHVPRQRGRWDPPEPATPGPEASRLHQMDPTMCDARPDEATPPRFHVPAYDWPGFSRAASPANWIAEDGDLPEVPVLITSEDTPRTILSGNYEWRLDAEPKNDRPSLWVHMMSRFVRTADLPALREELDGTDLTDIIARISGAMFADGFVGEYPFGQHFAAELHVKDHEHEEPFAVPTAPTTYDILGEYEYSPVPTVSLLAPAPDLFGSAPGALRWDGRCAWRDDGGNTVAVVRRVFGGGQNELTIDRAWLTDWLQQRELTIVWLETIGKDILRTHLANGHYGRLLCTRVRYQNPDGTIAHLPLVFERISADSFEP